MKVRSTLSSLLLATCLCAPAHAESLQAGDTYADMIDALGQPQGSVVMNDKVVYLYAEGSVSVADDLVQSVNLRSPDEMAREAEVRVEQAEQQQAHLDRIREKGQKLKTDKLTDPEFLALSSGEQLAFWKNFSHHYPDVDISAIVMPLAERHAKEQAELASVENIIQAQQARIQQLEQQLKLAQAQIEELENRPTYYANYGTSYPAYYPYPQSKVIIVNTGDKQKPHPPHHQQQGKTFKVGGVTVHTQGIIPSQQQSGSSSNITVTTPDGN